MKLSTSILAFTTVLLVTVAVQAFAEPSTSRIWTISLGANLVSDIGKTIKLKAPEGQLYEFHRSCFSDKDIAFLNTLKPKVSAPKLPISMPVISVRYFPVKGKDIDINVTGDVSGKLDKMRDKVNDMESKAIKALTEGTRYRGYRNKKSKPSLVYEVKKTYEFLEPVPTVSKGWTKTPVTDYNAIMKRINGRKWIDQKGVKEIWIWGYHGGKVILWESNMASPFGDTSNSNRDPDDLPICSNTYVVYHYNYGRSANEAVHNHLHQIEHIINYVDGRYVTPDNQWSSLLFWGKFVGSDRSHKLVNPGCGWCHYPPNAKEDYEYHSKRNVMSDILDWNPDRTGKKRKVNNNLWDDDEMKWYVLWLQSIPGANNGLTYKGSSLENWWLLKGDWDYVMKSGLELTKPEEQE